MKVLATQRIGVEISEEEQKRIFLDYLYQNFNWQSGYYIQEKEGLKVFGWEYYDTSHSWRENVFIREASTTDLAVFQIISKLKDDEILRRPIQKL